MGADGQPVDGPWRRAFYERHPCCRAAGCRGGWSPPAPSGVPAAGSAATVAERCTRCPTVMEVAEAVRVVVVAAGGGASVRAGHQAVVRLVGVRPARAGCGGRSRARPGAGRRSCASRPVRGSTRDPDRHASRTRADVGPSNTPRPARLWRQRPARCRCGCRIGQHRVPGVHELRRGPGEAVVGRPEIHHRAEVAGDP